jgi:hypothetical protein
LLFPSVVNELPKKSFIDHGFDFPAAAASVSGLMEGRRSTIVSLILLLAVALAMFGDLLFAGGPRVLGHPGSDMFLQYFAWREFGFRELAKGNLALWNPHIFSGAPYFGGMQGALLYPPNWLFLVLPTPVAINWSVALHVFAIGAFMLFWMKQPGLSDAASFFAGTLVMFCGAFFPHVFAGHLPQLSAMTWTPLIFCCDRRRFQHSTPRKLSGLVVAWDVCYRHADVGRISAVRLLYRNHRRALRRIAIDRSLELADRSRLAEHLSSRRSAYSRAIAALHPDNARNYARV